MNNERGSMHLEAAVALPFFILFFFVLSWMISLAATEAALRDAVNETVKTVSAHAYPADLLLGMYLNHPNRTEAEKRLASYLPLAAKALLENNSGINSLWAVPLVMNFVDVDKVGNPLLDESRLSVSNIVMPTFVSDESSYFGITAEYRLPIPFPFMNKDIVLTVTSIERCWVGSK